MNTVAKSNGRLQVQKKDARWGSVDTSLVSTTAVKKPLLLGSTSMNFPSTTATKPAGTGFSPTGYTNPLGGGSSTRLPNPEDLSPEEATDLFIRDNPKDPKIQAKRIMTIVLFVAVVLIVALVIFKRRGKK